MIKISIIIPIYNGAKYIERCVESIKNQTLSFDDFQIILINDGSLDNTEFVCKKLKEKYKNISYYYKANGGVSSARNMGISKAEGKYILFLDHDDYLDNNYIELLYNFAEKNNLNIVRSGYKIVNENEEIIETNIYSNNSVIIDDNNFSLFIESPFFCYGGGLFIRRNAVGNTRFDINLKFAEDLVFIRKCYKNHGKMGYINTCGYNYYVNVNSATKSGNLNSRIRECEDNIKVFSTFAKYNVSISKVKSAVFSRLNMKLKYLIKTTNVSFREFKHIVENLYEMEEIKKLKDVKICKTNEKKKNLFLIKLLIDNKLHLYYSVVKLYILLRK